MNNKKPTFVFFGTSEISTTVLSRLEASGFLPAYIICSEDKPVGRKMIVTPPEAKLWAEKRNIPVFQPKTLREEKDPGITEKIKALVQGCELFIVASYGKIIPQAILDIPTHGTLNVHPSLLPRLRGPSPIQSAILTENETGVSIMLLDALMDHGPILAQEKTHTWKTALGSESDNSLEKLPYSDDLMQELGVRGGDMLAQVIPGWMNKTIVPVEQDHSLATICSKIKKEDGLIDISGDSEINLRKIRAYRGWPYAYFFFDKNGAPLRIKIVTAHIEHNTLVLDTVIPEGKKEMKYSDFLRGIHN